MPLKNPYKYQGAGNILRTKRKNRWWTECFKDSGLKLTAPRQAILEILRKSDHHLSAEDIYWRVQRNHPNIGLTTVYRTLEALLKSGLLLKFDFNEGKARYELCPDLTKCRQQHHYHLVCIKCKDIIDYEELIDEYEKLLIRIEEKISAKYKFKVAGHQLKICGICPDCQ